MRTLYLYIICLASTILTVQAQSSEQRVVTRQWQSWYTAEGRLNVTDKWQIRLELETDRNQLFSQDNQYQGRLSASFRPNKILEVAAGFGYFGQDADSLQAFDDPLGTELRPHQEVILHLKGNWFTFKPTLRLEQRFLRDVSRQEIDDSYDFNHRFRIRLEATAPLRKNNEKGVGQLQAVVYNELMINAGQQASTTFNQNRVYAGLNYTLLKSLQIEAGYMNQFQKRSSGNRFWNRDIMRITASYSLNLK